MNERIQNFARNALKDDLAKLPESNKRMFIRMYGKSQSTSINDVIDAMPAEKLDCAMCQVDRTLAKAKP